jgi:RecA-family ATPase
MSEKEREFMNKSAPMAIYACKKKINLQQIKPHQNKNMSVIYIHHTANGSDSKSSFNAQN